MDQIMSIVTGAPNRWIDREAMRLSHLPHLGGQHLSCRERGVVRGVNEEYWNGGVANGVEEADAQSC
jgi:hypothetical protein